MPESSSKAVRRKLSGSDAYNKSIVVDATSSPGTLIHTAVSGTTDGSYDEVWLYAYNGHTEDVVLTIEEGSGDSLPVKQTIPYQSGWVPIKAGFVFQNGLEIRAYAGVDNVIKIGNFVNRITD